MSKVSPLYRAISDGDCDALDALLAGRDVNMRTEEEQWNLLHIALEGVTYAPNPDVIRHLIKLGVDVNAKDWCRWTPLHYAARRKSPAADLSLSTACVKLLIDTGADVNAKNDEGITPLHEALHGYPVNLEMIETLLAAGADMAILRKYVSVVAGPEVPALIDLLAKYDKEPGRQKGTGTF